MARLVLPALSCLQLVQAQATVCSTLCFNGETFPAVTFTSLAATLNVNVFAITSVRFTVDAGVDALINVTGYDAGASPCPFFRMVTENWENNRPRYEHSSRGWSFGNPTFSNGMVSLPLSFACPSVISGAHSSSAPLLALGAMASLGSAASLAAAACTLPVAEGQPSCSDGCQPFAHVELVGAHPNVTIDESSYTFTCPEEGCGVDSSCSLTAVENRCDLGYVDGRPFSTEDGPVVSSLIQSKASAWAEDLGPAGVALNASKAQAWRLSGLAEHSSVAAFARAALELMAVGAPAELVADAHQAAIDEVRHASRAFALAQLFGGDQVAPSAFPLKPELQISTNLSEVVRKNLEEGCMAEMVSLAKAKEQLLQGGLITHEEMALQQVFQDEARHAALAWRTVQWALRSDGSDGSDRSVREVLQRALRHLSRATPSEKFEKSETAALHHEVMRRSTIPWLRSLLQTQTFSLAAEPEAESVPAQAASATAKAVAQALGVGSAVTV